MMNGKMLENEGDEWEKKRKIGVIDGGWSKTEKMGKIRMGEKRLGCEGAG